MSFNSKLVRLKVEQLINMKRDLELFQFQTGSIKSVDLLGMSYQEIGFNSKLVRLKEHPASRLAACNPRFNSKLVRLKEGFDSDCDVFHTEFQFQTGSIKSL